jgi:hypothetical protein
MYDHVVSTVNAEGLNIPLVVQVTGSGSSLMKVVNGTTYVQHNLAKTTGKVVANSVSHIYGCCYPNGGSYQTTFSGGANNGKSETLSFSAATCTLGTLGQATLTNIYGVTSTVNLTHCL